MEGDHRNCVCGDSSTNLCELAIVIQISDHVQKILMLHWSSLLRPNLQFRFKSTCCIPHCHPNPIWINFPRFSSLFLRFEFYLTNMYYSVVFLMYWDTLAFSSTQEIPLNSTYLVSFSSMDLICRLRCEVLFKIKIFLSDYTSWLGCFVCYCKDHLS